MGSRMTNYCIFKISNFVFCSNLLNHVGLPVTVYVGDTCWHHLFACMAYFVPLDKKGCICHFTKWQIHPFISKVTICICWYITTISTVRMIYSGNTRRWTLVVLVLGRIVFVYTPPPRLCAHTITRMHRRRCKRWPKWLNAMCELRISHHSMHTHLILIGCQQYTI